MKPEPSWWAEARRLKAERGWGCERIARLVKRAPKSVHYALYPEWRERRKAEMRRKWRGYVKPRTREDLIRDQTLRAAHEESAATGRGVDEILIGWGAQPRHARSAA